MYAPAHFRITGINRLEAFIGENGFVKLDSKGREHPQICHIPLELEQDPKGEKVLHGHLAKSNPHLQSLKSNENVLVVFQSSIPISKLFQSSANGQFL